jgi:hypothetical protein
VYHIESPYPPGDRFVLSDNIKWTVYIGIRKRFFYNKATKTSPMDSRHGAACGIPFSLLYSLPETLLHIN